MSDRSDSPVVELLENNYENLDMDHDYQELDEIRKSMDGPALRKADSPPDIPSPRRARSPDSDGAERAGSQASDRSPSPARQRSPSPARDRSRSSSRGRDRSRSLTPERRNSPEPPRQNSTAHVQSKHVASNASFESHSSFHHAGQEEGQEIWRIEQFEPVRQNKETHGTFYSGDCYIILRTHTRPGNNKFHYDLHFWIGADSTQDEAGAVALRAVELDESVFGGAAVQYREVQAHESKLFLSYFKKNIRYLTGGVASGFTHVDRHTRHLFQIKGRKNIRVAEVPCMCGSLNQGDTFVLVVGRDIYVWIGPGSTDKEKRSGVKYAKLVRDEEFGGKAVIHIVDDWNTNMAFFKALGSQDKAIKAADEHDDEDIIRKLDQATLLYVIYDEQHVREVGQRPFKQSILDSKKCYILDSGPTGMFLWTGKKTSNDVRRTVWKRIQEFMDVRGYPYYLPVMRVVDGGESPLFKQYFETWTEPAGHHEDDSHVAGQNYDGARGVDVKSLHRQTSRTEEWMPDDGSGELKVWRIQDRELAPVPEKAYGVFFGGDSYVILYTYGVPRNENVLIYFWQGTKSTYDEQGAAALQTIALDEKFGGRAVQIRVVQHKEPAHFLKIFKGKLVYFMGGHISGFRSLKDYEDFDPKQPTMFQVRGTENAVRAMQLAARGASLNSNDVFAVDAERKTFIWIGRFSSDEELRAARQLLRHMSPEKGEPVEMDEGKESGTFWALLGGEERYYTGQKLRGRGLHIPSRLYHCSMSSGKFTVEQIVDFTQNDLYVNDVMMLDTFDEILVWVGKGATEFEKKESYKTAETYLKVDPSGRTSSNTLIVVVKQGFEPPHFTGCFPAWDNELWNKGLTFDEIVKDVGKENAGIALLEKEVEKYTSFYPYEELRRRVPPEGVDARNKEMYLSPDDFRDVFRISKNEYKKIPEWKRIDLKKRTGLF